MNRTVLRAFFSESLALRRGFTSSPVALARFSELKGHNTTKNSLEKAGDNWVPVTDKATGGTYFWNTRTNETTAVGEPKPGPEVRVIYCYHVFKETLLNLCS